MNIERIRGNLPFAPDVRAQLPARNAPIAGPVDSSSQQGATRMDQGHGVKLSDGAVHTPLTDITRHGEHGDREPFRENDLHIPQSRTFCDDRKEKIHSFSVIAGEPRLDQTVRMARPKKSRDLDPWQQRLRFYELLDAKLSEGVTLEEVAKILGLKTTSSLLTSYRHDFSRIPKRNVMEKAAPYFGVPLWEIYGPKPDEDDAYYQLCLELARTAQGSRNIDNLTKAQILHMGDVALAAAKATLSTR